MPTPTLTPMEHQARPEVVRRLVERLGAGKPALIVGGPGSGRTHVLHHLDQGSGRHLVRGRESVAGTPLVPFAHLIPRDDGAEPLEAIAVYSEVPRRLRAAEEHLLVDDAHLLDKASAVLLAQALRAGVPVVLSAPSRSELPSVVADAAREVGLDVVTLEPLDDEALLRLVAVELGGQLAVPDARALLARADGSPGLALALVVAAQDAGRVRHTPGGYRIDGFVVTERARTLAGVDLDGLSAEATTALESLVITGRLPATSLSAELGADLARRGLADHAGHELAVAGPLVADLVAEVFTGARGRASARSALELIPSTGWDVERRALGVLADVVTDGPATIASAAWLLGRGRPRPALDLLVSVAQDVSMLMLRAEAQLETGDVGAAVADLDTAAQLATTDQELLGIARGWTFCLGGNLSDDTDLEDRIRKVLPRFTDEEIRRQVRGALAQRRIVLGSRGANPDVAAPHEAINDEAAPTDQVVVALRAAMDGDVTTARAEAAPSVEGWAGDDVEFEEQMRVLAHFLSLVYDGQLVEARDVALTPSTACARRQPTDPRAVVLQPHQDLLPRRPVRRVGRSRGADAATPRLARRDRAGPSRRRTPRRRARQAGTPGGGRASGLRALAR